MQYLNNMYNKLIILSKVYFKYIKLFIFIQVIIIVHNVLLTLKAKYCSYNFDIINVLVTKYTFIYHHKRMQYGLLIKIV